MFETNNTVNKTVIVDINDIANAIDRILGRFDEQRGCYIATKRMPLVGPELAAASNGGCKTYDVPTMPIESALLLKDIVHLYNADINPNREVLFRDPLNLSPAFSFLPTHIEKFADIEDAINWRFGSQENPIDRNKIFAIEKLISKHFNPVVCPFIEMDAYAVYDVNVDFCHMIVRRTGDPRAIRYDVAVEKRNVELRYSGETDGN